MGAEANIDNVDQPNRALAKLLAMTPEQVEAAGDWADQYYWFRHYHRQGSEFSVDGDVSRLWVLNEDGACDPAVYNRNAPFDDYSPFEFSTVADETVTARGGWISPARRLWPVVSASADGRTLGVWVEISFDSGSTWQLQSSGVRAAGPRRNLLRVRQPRRDHADRHRPRGAEHVVRDRRSDLPRAA